ncbi:MAG: DUF5696 domain-containing protein [Halanaerobiales bacterium]
MKLHKAKLASFVLLMLIVLINPIFIDAAEISVADGFELVSENEDLELYINRETTEIAVRTIETGTIWYSNPQERSSQETTARGDAKKKLASQLIIKYFTSDDVEKELNNYEDSVEYGQYQISDIDNGVQIDYIMGKLWRDEDYLPKIVTKEIFEGQILDNLRNDQERELFLNNYRVVKLVEISDTHKKLDIYNFKSDQVFGQYTLVSSTEELSDSRRSNLIDNLLTRVIDTRNDIGSKQEINGNDLDTLVELLKREEVYILKDRLAFWDIDDMTAILKEVSYTPEDTQESYKICGLDPPVKNPVVFEVSVQYLIEEGDFLVRIPADKIRYPDKVLNEEGKRVSYPLTSINVLRYFNAGHFSDNGYIFIPDGSGALINLNNNKLNALPYNKQVYGRDYSVQKSRDLSQTEEQIYLPVFGIKSSEKALFGVIEAGDTIARINADIAGRNDSYNKVSARFDVIQAGQTSLPSQHWLFMNVYQQRMYNGELRLRYKFLEGAEADYVGMANTYRQYLIDNGVLEKLNPNEKSPFLLDLIGAIDRKRPVVGVPLKVIEPLTTFDDAKIIIDQLIDDDISNLIVNYSGLLKDGLRCEYPYDIQIEGKLGGRNGYSRFKDYLADRNIPLYSEIPILNSYRNRFDITDDSARFIDRKPAQIFEDAVDEYDYQRNEGESRYIVSPLRFDRLFDNNLRDFERMDMDSLSFTYMGEQLNADYYPASGQMIDRQQALEIILEQIEKLKEKDKDIILSGVNAPFLQYIDMIKDIPMDSSNFLLFDQTIPFYQIVVHGYIPYSGEAINMADDYRFNLLKSIEIGAVPYYKWIYRDPSIIKEAEEFDQLDSVYYKDWINNAVNYYKSSNQLLSDLYDQTITGHSEIQTGVSETLYENGIRIIVNYNKNDVIIDGYLIEAEDYKVFRGEES